MTAHLSAQPVAVQGAPAIPGLAFRRGRPGEDWPLIVELVNRARAADGVDEVLTADALRSEYELTSWFETDRDLLVAELDGEPVAISLGYRMARGSALALEGWGAVLPEHRHRGIGTAMHRAMRARLAAEAATDPRPGPRHFQAWALEAERPDVALLVAEGYVAVRFGFEMRRFITGSLPQHSLPPGLELRPVTANAHRAIFDADNEAFRDHWGYREMDDGDYRARFDNPETDTSLWCVAWDGDEVAGVVMNGIFAEENERLGIRRGWLEHVSVRRAWRGRGVAKALCAASFSVLRDRGMDEAWLGVDGSNPTGALQLYEGLGFHVTRRWQAYGRPLDGPAPEGWRPEGVDPG